jgi:AcrR family transcriptional regulator
MSTPVMTKLRARSDDDKELRRRAILAAARRLLERAPVGELTVADVAREAGLAKGSVFRYFPTREELVLAVFEEELAAMFAHLGQAIAATPALSGEALARLLAHGLVERPVFLQLATVVHAVLERNISLPAAVRFKTALDGHLQAAGAMLEARWPNLRPGQGARIFLRTHALLIGL